MAGILGMITGNAPSASMAQEAQMLRNGGVVVQMNPESKQIIFAIEEGHFPPIVFDLKTGTIMNAQFPTAEAEEY
jgi:hypothetical protein